MAVGGFEQSAKGDSLSSLVFPWFRGQVSEEFLSTALRIPQAVVLP